VCLLVRIVPAFYSMIPVSQSLLELRCFAIEESKSSVDEFQVQGHNIM
jgi:hypothetical protein